MTATTKSATPSNAPPSPPPAIGEHQPPAAPAYGGGSGGSGPRRPMRPLAPGQIQLAEFAVRHHVVTLAANQSFEHITDPDFWANVAQNRFRPCDRIDVHDVGGRFFAELYVRQVHEGRAATGAKPSVLVHMLRHVEFEPLDTRAKPKLYEVKFMGPAQGWSIIRTTDGNVMAENLENRDIAEKRLASMNVSGN
jgi:hypothetical protein